ncbi:quinon protein alcohol dehydrogenase-like superfamily [Gorgonomyces haynaldii]|nr:quinon protein alcohol dehydrogenase-like superfamily [Gorgonomyces haynaldii]
MSFTRKFTFAPQPGTTRGQAVHMGGDPKGNTFLYTNGRAVIIRDIKNPEIAKEYTQHTCQATVARYAPSGYYIASGDVQGNIRIWDTTQSENILKTETKPFSGRINDLDWDFESKRLIAVGEGKDKFGHAFLFDSASSVGEISGHSKVINAVSIRPGRPLRAVTASDDMTVNFYHGVPFKFNKSISDHSRFVQSVKYSPNGDFFVSAGLDTKLFLYDGKTGDKVEELSKAQGTHTGGVYSVSWSPDSLKLLSASGDKTAKIWDIATKTVVNTYTFTGLTDVDNQQVGCLWQGEYVITLSLSGDINYLDPRTGGTPVKVVKGSQKGMTSLTVAKDKTLFTGSYDGRVCAWQESSGSVGVVSGPGHTNQVIALAPSEDKVYSTGLDDSFRSLGLNDKTFTNTPVPTGAVPKGLAVHDGLAVLTAGNTILLLKDGSKIGSETVKYTPTASAISPDGKTVAVGAEETQVYLYTIDGSKLTQKAVLESNRGAITCLSFNPKGDLLAAGDTARNVLVYDTNTNEVKINQWVFHNARVNCVSWSPDGLHAVSGSLDTNVEVWSVEKPMKHISIKNAHTESVTGTVFLDNETVVSVGQDAFVKGWKLVY